MGLRRNISNGKLKQCTNLVTGNRIIVSIAKITCALKISGVSAISETSGLIANTERNHGLMHVL